MAITQAVLTRARSEARAATRGHLPSLECSAGTVYTLPSEYRFPLSGECVALAADCHGQAGRLWVLAHAAARTLRPPPGLEAFPAWREMEGCIRALIEESAAEIVLAAAGGVAADLERYKRLARPDQLIPPEEWGACILQPAASRCQPRLF